MDNQISFFQVSMILMLSIGLMNHVIVIPLLLDVAGRDAWISVLLAFGLYGIWIALFYYMHIKTEKKQLTLWLKQRVGTWPVRLLIGVMAVYLFCMSLITMKDTMTWINISFLPGAQLTVNTVIFSLLCFVNAYFGLRSIATTSGILLPFVVVLGLFVMTFNYPHKDYAYLQPILENGIQPVLRGMMYVGAGFVEMILLLFIQHYLSTSLRIVPLYVLALILTGLTLGPLIGAITEFGPIQAMIMRYPAFEEWRLVRIGSYVEHLDFFSIYQWFSGAFIRVSLAIFLIVEVLGVKDQKKKLYTFGVLFISLIAFVLYPVSDVYFYEWIYKFLPYLLGWAMMIFVVIFFLVFIGVMKRGSRT